jgi:hypothetical protein
MRALLAIAFLLAGCAMAPEGTSLDRMHRTLYHESHPEWGRPVTAEQRPDFTGTHPAISRAAEAAWKVDVEACNEAYDRARSFRENALQMWDCMWARGWR